jgi:hypothetical protein
MSDWRTDLVSVGLPALVRVLEIRNEELTEAYNNEIPDYDDIIPIDVVLADSYVVAMRLSYEISKAIRLML